MARAGKAAVRRPRHAHAGPRRPGSAFTRRGRPAGHGHAVLARGALPCGQRRRARRGRAAVRRRSQADLRLGTRCAIGRGSACVSETALPGDRESRRVLDKRASECRSIADRCPRPTRGGVGGACGTARGGNAHRAHGVRDCGRHDVPSHEGHGARTAQWRRPHPIRAGALMRITLLHSADALEPPVDPVIEQLASTMEILHHAVTRIPVDADIVPVVESLKRATPELVFNLTESFAGVSSLDSNLAALLNLLGLRYTGSSPSGLMLAGDKSLTKKVLSFHGIRSPEFATVYRGALDWAGDIGFPLIVKPPQEDASIGITNGSVVNDLRELF